MGNLLSANTRSDPEEILAGLIPMPSSKPVRIISLDGNIGVGKTTLLEHIRKRFPNVVIVPEPVDTWTRLKDEQGRNLLQLFYQDKRRWAFSFQQAAMLSRLLLLQKAVAEAAPGQICCPLPRIVSSVSAHPGRRSGTAGHARTSRGGVARSYIPSSQYYLF